MSTSTVSPKYQVVIPKDVREQMHIKTGQKLSFLVIKGVLHIVPVEPLEKLAGFLKGMDTSDIRDEEDRF
ncbi:MAG: AbrB/MazE/SpoVT family DNA-binding domain-containing protein [Nitrospirae bacterium]|nr:AbrB/MazE/SpoVT family DNA-binding domain-containing protein [Nitrospirota bacterium]